jgi:hypothetical protein
LRGASILALCSVLASLVAMVVPGGASASVAEGTLYPPGGFSLPAANGYRMLVAGVIARKGRSAAVLLVLQRPHEGAVYSAPATVTETSIQADLGALGKIDVSFHADGSTQVVKPRCGPPISLAGGSYQGTISFHGENGYTAAEATQAAGDIGFFLNLICPGISGTVGPRYLPGAELDVGPRSDLAPHLKVVKNSPRARSHFEVGVDEQHDGVQIERFADPIERAGAFQFDPLLQTATVHPPAPFSGSATYRRSRRRANRWTGNLNVDLPGRENVGLTGTGFRATLAPARWDWLPGG